MVAVYIWLPTVEGDEKAVGHAALQVQSTYMSWWPERAAGPVGDFHPIRRRAFMDDTSDEGRAPDWAIHLNGLNEAAMLDWWQTFGLTRGIADYHGPLPPYSLWQRNCSTVVATALKKGGADQFANWYSTWSVVWRPRTVLAFTLAIQKGLASK